MKLPSWGDVWGLEVLKGLGNLLGKDVIFLHGWKCLCTCCRCIVFRWVCRGRFWWFMKGLCSCSHQNNFDVCSVKYPEIDCNTFRIPPRNQSRIISTAASGLVNIHRCSPGWVRKLFLLGGPTAPFSFRSCNHLPEATPGNSTVRTRSLVRSFVPAPLPSPGFIRIPFVSKTLADLGPRVKLTVMIWKRNLMAASYLLVQPGGIERGSAGWFAFWMVAAFD